MHRRVFIGFLAVLSFFLVGFSPQTAPQIQTSSGIVWQSYSLDDQGYWQLDSIGQNLTQTKSSLSTDSAGLIDQPSLLSLRGRIPEGGLTLILDANITVGASWDLVRDIQGVKLEILDFTPYTDLRGSPGRMTVLITSNSRESQDIQLTYHRPWLTDENPERRLVLSALTFPLSIDLSHKIIIQTPAVPSILNNGEEVKSIEATYSPETLPADYDLRNVAGHVYVTPARDQGFCGSCWSYAVMGVAESRLLLNDLSFSPATLDLSEQYLISCNRSYFDCKGGNSTSNDYLMNKYGQMYNPPGIVLESNFPESAYKNDYPSTNLGCPLDPLKHNYLLSDWDYVYQGSEYFPNTWRPYDDNPAVFAQNRDLIKSAIITHGAVGAGMFTGFTFSAYTGGIFYEPTGSSTANHDIVIVGWHDTGDPATSYWIIKNSKGPSFGNNGFADIGFTSPVIGSGAYYVDIPDVYYGGSLGEHVYLPLIKRPTTGTAGQWVTVFSDDFERDELGTGWDANDGSTHEYDPATYSGYFWGISDCRATTTGGKSLWVVGDSVAGVAPLSCGSAYDNSGRLNSLVTFGPIDLTNATSAFMKFKLWLNIQRYGVWQLLYEGDPEVTYDDIYGYGYDAISYSANAPWAEYMSFPYNPGNVMGNTSGWRTMLLNFADMDGSHFSQANLLGSSDVYIYFGASSDEAEVGDYSEGIFIDDILIKKCINGFCSLDWLTP
jgi:C1A family cysteine protease